MSNPTLSLHIMIALRQVTSARAGEYAKKTKPFALSAWWVKQLQVTQRASYSLLCICTPI